MSVEHYPNAPIIEATLDIQVKASSPLPAQAAFLEFAKSVSDEYPNSADINHLEVSLLPAGPAPTIGQAARITGVRLTQPGNERALMVQQRGLTFSHMPPYTSWATFQPEARKLWRRYMDIVKPVGVERVALRYVNRIDIAQRSIELEDYFDLYPHVSKSIKHETAAFFMQVQLPQSDMTPTTLAVINFASADPGGPNICRIILDIDVFTMHDFPASVEEPFAALENIRARKNELFESFITDKTRKLFQ
jgi:uncharacterized protein (TIGR04255 family)